MSDYFFDNYFTLLKSRIFNLDSKKLYKTISIIKEAQKIDKKLIFFENSDDASMLNQLSIEFTKFVNLKTMYLNKSVFYSISHKHNQIENWVEKAVSNCVESGDVLLLFSLDRKNNELIDALNNGLKSGVKIITFSGYDSEIKLRKKADVDFWVDTRVKNIIRLTHQVWIYSILDYLRNEY